ncbi:glyoxylase-like metal-dependent hydrolase (beta-lactamase superfamily II) [Rhodoferax ferrireducens]|uniref:Glyoxylase-like metal-dependent hydrolase (Beta-lactamase superfamily II) n=1 Tax=Rhodoferax ferrireducens TaxID=192843 RepID=A0ABU2C315_9BURK|nr:MBL fold metallo-hydrolase [Rhodoferax ferrireducens]MDR7375729.1 glyoxylase-like metal-dependent hydrolase (beta-lactamase superfamily II) [Rhodoferax ferrireducens]
MIRTTIVAASLAIAFTAAHAAQPLTVKVYNADGNSFNVNSTLVYGEKEAMVIDAGFTRADALRIAANVLDSGKQLKTIYVSQADPDYYFGVETLKEIFPQADVVTTPAVLEKIVSKMSGKLTFWGPKMGANAPRTPVVPRALQGTTLTLEGQSIEIRGTTGLLAHRPYAWIPSIQAVVGNIGVFGNMHVWTADSQTAQERAAWVAQLDEMAALKPVLVVPGHMKAGTQVDASAIGFTKNYLQTFEKNLAASKNSAELVNAMKQAYPQVTDGAMSLDIGAKVNKGEMKW